MLRTTQALERLGTETAFEVLARAKALESHGRSIVNLGIGQQTPPVASVLLTVCSNTGLNIEQVMGYCKWFILAMFVTLMIVTFSPATALWFK